MKELRHIEITEIPIESRYYENYINPKWLEIRKKWIKLISRMPEGVLSVYLEESIDTYLKPQKPLKESNEVFDNGY